MEKVIIYKTKDGLVEVNVNLMADTVWLTQKQLSELFNKDVRTISEHIKNIFIDEELEEKEVIRKFKTTAVDGKKYTVKHYNLDVIISLGYKVHSKRGLEFRKWATRILKAHLVEGYTINTDKISKKNIVRLKRSIELLTDTLAKKEISNDINSGVLNVIIEYANTWQTLLEYDNAQFSNQNEGTSLKESLKYSDAKEAVSLLKAKIFSQNEASTLFGLERGESFQGIIAGIEQTFDNKPLYDTVEKRASHLLYFIIKDHPFSDGNKRIACLIFLIYLKRQGLSHNLNEQGLVTLALLIAESKPEQKELMINLINNLLS